MSQRPFSSNFRSRLNPRASTSSVFRDFPLDDDDMFFESATSSASSPSSWDFPTSRLGSTVFDTFPRRSTMRSSGFPSSHFDSEFTSPRWHHPSWVEDELRRSRGSSPMDAHPRRSPTPPTTAGSNHQQQQQPGPSSRSGSGSPGVGGQSFFSSTRGADGYPIKVSHEGSRSASRSSTPSSNNGEAAGGGGGSGVSGHDHDGSESPQVDGAEKFPGVSSKVHSKSAPFTARRQPKVHHIPIHVEPRDDNNATTTTPPTSNSFGANGPSFERPVSRTSSQSDVGSRDGSPSSSPRQQRREMPPQQQMGQRQSTKKQSSNRGARSVPVQVERDSPRTQQQPPPPVPPPSSSAQMNTDQKPPLAPEKSPSSPRVCRKPPPPTPAEVMETVLTAVQELKPRLEAFSGTRSDKEYLFLDEMLTRNLIRLDNIMTDGNEELRQARRAAIRAVNTAVHALEARVVAPEGNTKEEEAAMDLEEDEPPVAAADKAEFILAEPNTEQPPPQESSAAERTGKNASSEMEVEEPATTVVGETPAPAAPTGETAAEVPAAEAACQADGGAECQRGANPVTDGPPRPPRVFKSKSAVNLLGAELPPLVNGLADVDEAEPQQTQTVVT